MTGLAFADTRVGQRVIGNKIGASGYVPPEGWSDQGGEITWKMGGAEEKTDSVLLALQPDTSLDLKPSECGVRTYITMFKKTEELVDVLKQKTAQEIQTLMGLSEKTSKSHLERFQAFQRIPAKQAILMFGGSSLRAKDFKEKDMKFAEKHVRIVSGLYGVLRPYDDVKPVRDLPMDARLATKRGKNLIEFWGDSITRQLAKDASAAGNGGKTMLVACMSDEYFDAVQPEAVSNDVRVVRLIFVGANEDYTRKARALLARFVIKNRITSYQDLKNFDDVDWSLDKFRTTSTRVVFQWVGDDEFSDKKGKKDKKEKGKEKGDKEEQDDKVGKAAKKNKAMRDSRSPSSASAGKKEKGTRKSKTTKDSRSPSPRSEASISAEKPAKKGRRDRTPSRRKNETKSSGKVRRSASRSKGTARRSRTPRRRSSSS